MTSKRKKQHVLTLDLLHFGAKDHWPRFRTNDREPAREVESQTFRPNRRQCFLLRSCLLGIREEFCILV